MVVFTSKCFSCFCVGILAFKLKPLCVKTVGLIQNPICFGKIEPFIFPEGRGKVIQMFLSYAVVKYRIVTQEIL